MKIAIDIDGTITRYPEFFSKLSHLWDDDVYILTFRSDMESAIRYIREAKTRKPNQYVFVVKGGELGRLYASKQGLILKFEKDQLRFRTEHSCTKSA